MSGLYKRALDFVSRHPHLRVLKAEELKEDDDGISEDERAQISAQIQAVVSQNKLRLDDKALQIRPRKRGWVFVLAVNIAAAILIAAGIYLAFELFGRQEQELVSERRLIRSVEGELLDALQAEADAQLSAKDQEIAGIEGRLAQATAERQRLQDETDEIIASREAQLRAQFEAELEAERLRLEAAGLSAAEIDTQVAQLEAQQTAELQAELEAARAAAEAEIAEQEAAFAAEIEAFQAELDDAAAERAELQEEFAAEAEALNAQLAEETARLESERASLISEFDAEVAQIRADFQRRLEEAQSAAASAVEAQQAALAEHDTTQAELEDTRTELNATNADLADTRAALAATESALSTTEGELGTTRATLDVTQSDLAATLAELATTETAVAEAEAALSGARADLTAALARAQQAESDAEAARAEAEAATSAAEAAARATVAEAEARRREAEEAEARRREAEEAAAATQAEVETALAAAEQTAAARDRAVAELAEAEERLATLEGTFTAAGAALEQFTNQYDTLLSRIQVGDFDAARVSLSSIRRAVNDGARSPIPSLANRSEVELLLLDSLDRLVSLEAAAVGLVDIDLVATASLVSEAAALLRQGQELEEAGDIGAATELYRAALARVPAAGAAFSRIEALSETAEMVDSRALADAIENANALYTGANYQEAASAYRQVLGLLPNINASILDNILDTGYRLRSAVDRVAFVDAAADAEAQIGRLEDKITGLESQVTSLEQEVSAAQNRYVDVVQSIDRALARIGSDGPAPATAGDSTDTTDLLATKLVLLRVLNSTEVRADYPDLYTETQVYLDALVEEERELAEIATLERMNSIVDSIGRGSEPDLPESVASRRLVRTFLETLAALLSE